MQPFKPEIRVGKRRAGNRLAPLVIAVVVGFGSASAFATLDDTEKIDLPVKESSHPDKLNDATQSGFSPPRGFLAMNAVLKYLASRTLRESYSTPFMSSLEAIYRQINQEQLAAKHRLEIMRALILLNMSGLLSPFGNWEDLGVRIEYPKAPVDQPVDGPEVSILDEIYDDPLAIIGPASSNPPPAAESIFDEIGEPDYAVASSGATPDPAPTPTPAATPDPAPAPTATAEQQAQIDKALKKAANSQGLAQALQDFGAPEVKAALSNPTRAPNQAPSAKP